VIEFGTLPAVEAMAALAIGGQIGRQVRGGSRLLKVGQVATYAISTQAVEDSYGCLAMAGIAWNSGVSAKQREAIEMVLHCVECDAPATHRVAILASPAKLAPVDIGMAIRALLAHLGEDFTDVALAASYVGVHGPQWVFRLRVVIELRLRPDRLPTHRRMATFAWDREGSVRILGLARDRAPWPRLPLGGLSAKQHRAAQKQHRRPCSALNQLRSPAVCYPCHRPVLRDTMDYHE